MTAREQGFFLLIQAVRTFVQRVEDGEVRSVRTYNAFVDALDLIDSEGVYDPEVAE